MVLCALELARLVSLTKRELGAPEMHGASFACLILRVVSALATNCARHRLLILRVVPALATNCARHRLRLCF